MFCLQKSVENIVIIVLIGNRYILNNVNVVLLNNDDKQGWVGAHVCVFIQKSMLTHWEDK